MITSIMTTTAQNSSVVCHDSASSDLGGTYARSEIWGDNPRTTGGLGHAEGYTLSPPCPLPVGKWKICTTYSGCFEQIKFNDYSVTINFYEGMVGSYVSSEALACGRSVSASAAAWYQGYCMTCYGNFTNR